VFTYFSFSRILISILLWLCFFSDLTHAQETDNDTLVRKYKERGFENITGVCFIFSEGHSALAVNTINGYRPNPNFFIGVGFGLELYNDSYLLPIYIDSRVNFIKGKFSPFIYFDTGYAFGKTESLDTMIQLGPLFNTGLGFKINVQGEVSICISVGYKYQMVKFHKDLYLLDGTYTEYNNNDYNMVVFRFELEF